MCNTIYRVNRSCNQAPDPFNFPKLSRLRVKYGRETVKWLIKLELILNSKNVYNRSIDARNFIIHLISGRETYQYSFILRCLIFFSKQKEEKKKEEGKRIFLSFREIGWSEFSILEKSKNIAVAEAQCPLPQFELTKTSVWKLFFPRLEEVIHAKYPWV